MLRSPNPNLHQSNGMPPSAEQVEEVLRFARKLEMHSDHEQLLRVLPAELCVLVDCSTTALIHWHEGQLTTHVVDSDGSALDRDHLLVNGAAINGAAGNWPEAVWQAISEQEKALVLPELDQPSPEFSEVIRFFRERGSQSLCLLPLSTALHRLGALCIGRKHRDAFSEQEVSFLSLISHYAALALDDRLNFAQSEQVRAQLEKERTKLRLILDLNNSVVSNLELRDVIQSISPGIRKALRVDGVALFLPDREGQELQLCALDFPDGNSAVRQNLPVSIHDSAAGQAFRSGKPWIGDIGQLQRAGLDHRIASAAGVETLCMLPLLRGNRVLGVLCLLRTEKNAFNQLELEFLSQIAGQVAIAIDNAFAYRQITELKDKLTQEKLYLEDELRSEMNFQEIIGNSPILRRVLRQVEAVAPTGSTVLIHGETGTGKELIARAVHNLSQRHDNSFVKLNCAAIPTGLLESELFGHEKGSIHRRRHTADRTFRIGQSWNHLPRRGG